MRRALIIFAVLVIVGAGAYAQSIGGSSGIGVRIGGVGGSGGGGGGGGGSCAGQLVLDYSSSCALIAQGWGQ